LKAGGDRLLYLYGITASHPKNFSAPAGVDALRPVEALGCDDFVVWVSQGSADEFGENLAANMENLEWLAAAGVAHQRVISAIARETEILPARFATIFRTEASLRKHVRDRTSELKRDFRRVKNADEWGVKVFAVDPVVRLPQVSSGTDYLKAKAKLLPKRRDRSQASGEVAEFEQALRGVAAETAAAGKISSGQKGLMFQTSVLVQRDQRRKFEALLKKFSGKWADSLRIECTGPWPPYSFVSRQKEGDDSQ